MHIDRYKAAGFILVISNSRLEGKPVAVETLLYLFGRCG